jgi:hypothetical protein
VGSTDARSVLAAVAIVLLLAGVDLFVLAPWIFRLWEQHGADELWMALPLTAAPRLVAGFISGVAVAMLTGIAPSIGSLVGYAALLVWSFHRYEAYVNWAIAGAIASAVVPYASGLIGMVGGIGVGRAIKHRFT